MMRYVRDDGDGLGGKSSNFQLGMGYYCTVSSWVNAFMYYAFCIPKLCGCLISASLSFLSEVRHAPKRECIHLIAPCYSLSDSIIQVDSVFNTLSLSNTEAVDGPLPHDSIASLSVAVVTPVLAQNHLSLARTRHE